MGSLLLLPALLPLAACGGSGLAPAKDRGIEDRERGVRYTLPAGWLRFGKDLRSPNRSLVTLQVHALEGADRKFVAGLPDTLLPQLEGWTKYYYVVDGEPSRSEAVIGGEKALEITWPVRTRQKDPKTRVTYWVVRHGDRLYVLRVAYAPGLAEKDEAEVRSLLASMAFL